MSGQADERAVSHSPVRTAVPTLTSGCLSCTQFVDGT